MKFMMNYTTVLAKSLVLVVFSAITFASCKKEKTNDTTFAGVWQGKWGDPNQTPQNFIKFEFKNNGAVNRLNEQNQVIATGFWVLNGVQFECTYTHTSDGQVHKIGGLYTDFDGAIVGTWGYSPSKTDGGTIELDKQ
jgi:hypothetical protein